MGGCGADRHVHGPRCVLASSRACHRPRRPPPTVNWRRSDAFDASCTELTVTANIDSGGRGRPRVTFDVTQGLSAAGVGVFMADGERPTCLLSAPSLPLLGRPPGLGRPHRATALAPRTRASLNTHSSSPLSGWLALALLSLSLPLPRLQCTLRGRSWTRMAPPCRAARRPRRCTASSSTKAVSRHSRVHVCLSQARAAGGCCACRRWRGPHSASRSR